MVEGDSDCITLNGLSTNDDIKLVAANGWENVITVNTQAQNELSKNNVFGVIDKDYREALAIEQTSTGLAITHSHIFETDNIDLDNMLFHFDSAAKKVLLSWRSKAKLENINEATQWVLNLASKLAKLRFHCQKHQLSVSLSSLDHAKFIDDKTVQIDSHKLINHINGKNPGKANISHDVWLQSQQEVLPDMLQETTRLCNGHDLMAILGISLRKKFGTNDSRDVTQDKIEKYFRMAVSKEEFETTELYASLSGVMSI